MSDVTESAPHGFTRAQLDWLERRIGASQALDRSTVTWLVGGLAALGVTAISALYVVLSAQIDTVREDVQSVRAEIRSVEDGLRAEIGENRAGIAEIARGQARIEAILAERLPR